MFQEKTRADPRTARGSRKSSAMAITGPPKAVPMMHREQQNPRPNRQGEHGRGQRDNAGSRRTDGELPNGF